MKGPFWEVLLHYESKKDGWTHTVCLLVSASTLRKAVTKAEQHFSRKRDRDVSKIRVCEVREAPFEYVIE